MWGEKCNIFSAFKKYRAEMQTISYPQCLSQCCMEYLLSCVKLKWFIVRPFFAILPYQELTEASKWMFALSIHAHVHACRETRIEKSNERKLVVRHQCKVWKWLFFFLWSPFENPTEIWPEFNWIADGEVSLMLNQLQIFGSRKHIIPFQAIPLKYHFQLWVSLSEIGFVVKGKR